MVAPVIMKMFLGSPAKGPQEQQDPGLNSPLKGKGSWKRWLIPGLGQGRNKSGLEHLLPESKEVLRELQGCV